RLWAQPQERSTSGSARREGMEMAAESVANLVFSGPLQWAEEAACRGESRLFFAPAGERPEARATREAQARAVCRSCEALVDCRAWAREHRGYGQPVQPRHARTA